MLTLETAVLPVPIVELRTYLRIETDAEDALLAGLIRAAASQVETWLGRLLLERTATERFADPGETLRLTAGPVAAVSAVTLTPPGGEPAPLAEADWRLVQRRDGAAEIQLLRGVEGEVRVTYRAGMAADWNGLPEELRLAVMRAAGHLHAHRDAAEDAGLPGAVRQLLAPWRRLRLN